jgi:hypothetical protein
MKQRLLLTALVLAFAVVVAPVAAADPVNAKNSTAITFVCDSETIDLVFNGNGQWAPAHVIDSTSVLVPTALDVVLTFTPPGGGPPSVDHAIVAKNANVQDTIECTIPLQTLFSGPEGTQTIVGSVTGFWTPR